MAEAALDANEDLSEEAEDLGRLQPDGGGEKATHAPVLLPHPAQGLLEGQS